MYSPQNASADSPHRDEIDVLGMLGTLIDHKWLIAGITGTCMLIGAAYAILATPVYQANALIQVEPKKNDMLGFSDVSSLLGKESPAVTEIELIKSRTIIGKTVDTLKLDITITPQHFPLIGGFMARRYVPDTPGDVAPPLFGISRYSAGGERLSLAKLKLPAGLLGTTLVLVAGENQGYQLFDEDDQQIAAGRVGEPFASGDVEVLVETLRANPGARFKIVRKPRLDAVADYQDLLNVVERGKESGIISLTLESTHPALAVRTLNEISNLYVRQNVDRTSAEAAQSLSFLNDQLPQVRRDLEKAENALNRFQTRSKSIDISLEAKAVLDQVVALDTGISELKLQQAEMDRKFTRQHPAYRALLAKLDELNGKQAQLTKRVEGLPSTQQELLSLTRDVQVGTEIYTQLLNRSQELDVMRAGTVGNVRLIDSADANISKPVEPRKVIVVLLAMLLGGMLSVGLVLVRSLLNRGLENPDDIEKLGLPVYASIPFSPLQKAEETHAAKSRSVAPSLLAVNHPHDLVMEAMRSLRTSLHFAMLEAKNNRLMISGPSPEVGKTFVSANLAAVVAQSGQRVLLIDADMRKGYLHKMLGKSVEIGLSDLLVKRCELQEAIKTTDVAQFDFIGRGQIPPNPSELLMHPNFAALLAEVSERYDLVIIDTPPLLAVTDAAIVGRQSGTSLLVTRFGVNSAKEVELTLRRFHQNGIELKGAIFNGVEKRRSASYGYGDYGYYHYAYQSDKA
ncbi:tyrosine-protein kinase [Pseudomonas fluorescens]|jgi:tyrosine-protein kinase Etk/Wzc|uniref:Polysaccharide biosynthesis tyrosine autokinase n=1 Tax=Pseudomonas fluorescens TaxID=294 RepID=A0A1B3DB32_PSEFL|nr:MULTISPECIES: polysaccharide biosynthesis tyrosine autokinase [Pseudomonas]AOE68687.1 tyrosine-protein kinase [Pseudomonas fluorescens]AOE74497.1 tyrosine-protein kinase [Pseudomonas fluorescens]QOU07698.1 polysaccharide biosynthesis tyrosine autokinase [Pseudomonas fluorescens]WEX13367.1 polysaccharide biosynthesis tyrosine autokinase [Pseudomonas sp. G11]